MRNTELEAAIECMLFVAGDPVPLLELQRVLNMEAPDLCAVLAHMQTVYREENRGVLLSITEETVQICSNKAYTEYVESLLQPVQQKTLSQSLLETLAVIAYRQPVTRADVEAVRGVRCEYAVSQLQKLNMIRPVGRKDTVGKPVLYGTTDAFLRHFGISEVSALPNYEAYRSGEPMAQGTLTV